MYCNIGKNHIIKTQDVIAIFNTKTIEGSSQNKKWQYWMKKNKGEGKSFLLFDKEEESQEVVLSEVSVATLQKRMEKGVLLNKREVRK